MKMKTALPIALALALAPTPTPAAAPDTVKFASADGKTELAGYVFTPSGAGPHPAIVMLHGRGGPYSSLKRGTYTAETLTMRHRMWGEYWRSRGYVALLVDSFGPRGYPEGFPKHSYNERPAAVSEQTVRPLDAYGALRYLRTREDVAAERIGLHGWSNGGMTLLSAMAANAPALDAAGAAQGFRAALAQYPSCRTQLRQGDYKPYAPLLILAAAEDDEVSPELCRDFAAVQRARGAAVEFVVYPGAQHSYDDPGKTKQSHEPNRAAMQDSLRRAEAFFARYLKHETVTGK
jgi:carboxymethylenebutenolidase